MPVSVVVVGLAIAAYNGGRRLLAKQHGDDVTRADADMKPADRGEAQAGGVGDEFVHAANAGPGMGRCA
jgi:hypothetical protein